MTLFSCVVVQEFAAIVIFAKQPENTPERFKLQPMPLSLNYDEFERVLLGMSYTMFMAHKRQDTFEDFVGEVLDYVYKTAGAFSVRVKDARVNARVNAKV